MDLKNKVAIVTGSRRGIGKGIVSALAKEGANIVVSDIDLNDCEKVVKKVRKLGVKALAVKCDVSNAGEINTMIKTTLNKFGRLDILINNAGIFPFKPFLEMTEADWNKVIDVNLKSIFLCSQAAAKVMKPGSKIVSISSIASFIAFPGLAHYCASKAAINGLTRSMALELASKKINVNAIAPGMIETPGVAIELDKKAKQQMILKIPLKRIGKPEDIAKAVLFLVSDKSDYITGQTIIVDGGWLIQ